MLGIGLSDNHVSTGKSKSKRKDFVASRVMVTMALILFREVLFIPLLNIKGGGGGIFEDDDDQNSDNSGDDDDDDDDACKFLPI